MLPPLAIKPAARLIGIDRVEIRPLGPPRILNWDINYYYDNTKWKLEQRRKKLDKIQEKINERKCHQQL
jgi:hypothetical protein